MFENNLANSLNYDNIIDKMTTLQSKFILKNLKRASCNLNLKVRILIYYADVLGLISYSTFIAFILLFVLYHVAVCHHDIIKRGYIHTYIQINNYIIHFRTHNC